MYLFQGLFDVATAICVCPAIDTSNSRQPFMAHLRRRIFRRIPEISVTFCIADNAIIWTCRRRLDTHHYASRPLFRSTAEALPLTATKTPMEMTRVEA